MGSSTKTVVVKKWSKIKSALLLIRCPCVSFKNELVNFVAISPLIYDRVHDKLHKDKQTNEQTNKTKGPSLFNSFFLPGPLHGSPPTFTKSSNLCLDHRQSDLRSISKFQEVDVTPERRL